MKLKKLPRTSYHKRFNLEFLITNLFINFKEIQTTNIKRPKFSKNMKHTRHYTILERRFFYFILKEVKRHSNKSIKNEKEKTKTKTYDSPPSHLNYTLSSMKKQANKNV